MSWWGQLPPSRAALAVFPVPPSDCCFACLATVDRYSALRVCWSRRHCWNNNRSACLYRAVFQFVQGTLEAQCKTIIYNNMASREHWSGKAHSLKTLWVFVCCLWGLYNVTNMELSALISSLWHNKTLHTAGGKETHRQCPQGWWQCSSTYSDNTSTYFW